MHNAWLGSLSAEAPSADDANETPKVSAVSDLTHENALPPLARVNAKGVSDNTSGISPAMPPTSSTQIDGAADGVEEDQHIFEDAPSSTVTPHDPSSTHSPHHGLSPSKPRPANTISHDACPSTTVAVAGATPVPPSTPPSPFRALQAADMHDDLDGDLGGSGTVPASPARTMAAAARGIIARLRRIVADASTLVLGPVEVRERREIEDLLLDVNREIVRAGRRGEEM